VEKPKQTRARVNFASGPLSESAAPTLNPHNPTQNGLECDKADGDVDLRAPGSRNVSDTSDDDDSADDSDAEPHPAHANDKRDSADRDEALDSEGDEDENEDGDDSRGGRDVGRIRWNSVF
jgi:hypothetical protein